MQKVIVLTETEYEDLKASEKTLLEVLEAIGRLKDKPEELKEYIENLLEL